MGESRIVNSFNKGNGRVSALPESQKQKGEDGYEGNDENSICGCNACTGGGDRGDGGANMVGTRRTEHRATGGRVGVLRGRWIRDLVHWGFGAQEGKIVAKTFYEVKGGCFYEVKGGAFYEVKCLTLYEVEISGDSSGDSSGENSGKNSGNFSGDSEEFSAVGNSRNRTAEANGKMAERHREIRQLRTAET